MFIRLGRNITVILCLLSIFMTSCSRPGGDPEEVGEGDIIQEKTDFFIETQIGNTFFSGGNLEKIGKLSSSQDISVNANVGGEITRISVQEGDRVSIGTQLARIDDTLGNSKTNLDRAKNGLDRARINYESQEISLDKQIFDAQIQIENLERSLRTLKQDSEQNILQAKDNLDTSRDTENLEKIELQIEKLLLQEDKLIIQEQSLDTQIENLKQSIAKAESDFQIRVRGDDQNITTFQTNTQPQVKNIELILADVIEFGDELLGVSDFNRRRDDSFEDFLGINSSVQKSRARTLLVKLIDIQDSNILMQYTSDLRRQDLSREDFTNILSEIDTLHGDIENFLNNLETTINNSVTSVGELSQNQLDIFESTVNGLQSQAQNAYSGFISFRASIDTFFESFEDNQDSELQAIELQKNEITLLEQNRASINTDREGILKDIRLLQTDRDILKNNLESGELSAQTNLERTQISIDDNIANLQTQIISAKNTLQTARRNKDITLRSLQNTIEEAQITYNAALKDFDKLRVDAPIEGSISEIFVDIGQEVSNGTPLFQLVNNSTPQLEISFSESEKDQINIGQQVTLTVDEQELPGTLATLSRKADENLNYKATIDLNSEADILGNLVSVSIPLESKKMLIPLNIIITRGGDIGTVKILDTGELRDVRVRMGEVYGEYVEIISCAENCVDLNIVTSDVSNFDINTFNIVEK